MVGHFLFQQIRFLYSRIAELRGYGSLRGAPDLISEEALESILHIAQQANYHNNDPLIMVSPTPVFGFELAEKLQGYLAHLSGPSTLAKDTVEILLFLHDGHTCCWSRLSIIMLLVFNF